jgi:hypothetical protein
MDIHLAVPRPQRYVPARRSLVLLALSMTMAVSAEAQPVEAPRPDPAQAALESIRAANVARSAAAGEADAWRNERERIEALIEANATDAQRLRQELGEVEKERQDAAAESARLGSDVSLKHARQVLDDTAAEVHRRLVALAASLPPGAVVVPAATGDDLDESVHALSQSERSAATLSIEVVPGRIDGHDLVVKLLRASGAAAWWLAMDGRQAGVAMVVDGHLVLTPVADELDADAIRRAITITEGRQAGAVIVLPLPRAPGSGS